MDKDTMPVGSGRVMKEDGSIVNLADILTAGYVATGSVSWAQSDANVKTFDITPPTDCAAGQSYLVSIYNPSTVNISVTISNMINFGGSTEESELVASSDFTVPAAMAVSKVVQGMLPGVTTRLMFALSSSAPAAFSAKIDVRRC